MLPLISLPLSGEWGNDSFQLFTADFLLIILGLFIGLLIAVAYLVSGIIHLGESGERPRSALFIAAAAMVPTLYAVLIFRVTG